MLLWRPRAALGRLLGERIEEDASNADGAADELEGLEALAEGDGDADDDDGALGGVGDALGGRGGLLDGEGAQLVVEVEVEAGGDDVVAQDGALLEDRRELAEARRLRREEKGQHAEGAEEGGEGDAAEGEEAKVDEPLVWVKTGSIVKAQVDEVLDKCAEMGHLRNCIIEAKATCDKASEEDQPLIRRQAANYLERYAYLLLFATYLKELKEGKLEPEKAAPSGEEGEEEEGEEGGTTQQSFTKWCSNNQEYLDIIGTRTKGALADFNFS